MTNHTRSRRPWAVATVVAAAWIGIAPAHATSTVADRLVAVVNDELITASEVQTDQSPGVDLLREILPAGVSNGGVSGTFGNTLEGLIDRHLLLQEARASGVSATEEEAAAAFAALVEQKRLSPIGGAPPEALRRRLQDQLTIVKLINREVRSKLLVSAEEIETAYREHPERFTLPPRYRLRQIVLKAPSDATPDRFAARMAEAESIREELQRGAEFGALARARSEGSEAAKGGDLGYFQRGELLSAIDSAIATMSEGEISPVIRSPLGLHVIKLEEVQTGRLKPLEEVRSEVEDLVYRERTEALFRQWLRRLRDRAHIDIK
jgi:peptidyl-prolyl cis-trans isomerase SurA